MKRAEGWPGSANWRSASLKQTVTALYFSLAFLQFLLVALLLLQRLWILSWMHFAVSSKALMLLWMLSASIIGASAFGVNVSAVCSGVCTSGASSKQWPPISPIFILKIFPLWIQGIPNAHGGMTIIPKAFILSLSISLMESRISASLSEIAMLRKRADLINLVGSFRSIAIFFRHCCASHPDRNPLLLPIPIPIPFSFLLPLSSSFSFFLSSSSVLMWV